MQLDKNNIEELIFMDKRFHKELPDQKHHFDQWVLGQRVPALRFLSQKSTLELLEQLNTPINIAILERYFKEKVFVKTIDYHVVRHHKVPLEDLDFFLNDMQGFANNFSVSRDDRYAYLSFWR